MNFAIFKATQDLLDAIAADKSRAWNAVADTLAAQLNCPKPWPMNLAPDAIRLHPDYRAAKAEYDSAFQELRRFNQAHASRFKRELSAFYAARRAAKQGS